jgi:hypothetical protein
MRGMSIVVGFVLLAGVAGCTKDPKPNYSSATPTGTVTTSSSPSPTPSSTAVPYDQIPPGNPVSWVPSGVPTNAPFKEPGDVVPMFNQSMFTDTQSGALGMAGYYLQARNWASATMNPRPFTLICDADKCKHDAPFFTDPAKLGQHYVGGRESWGAPIVIPAPAGKNADWVVQLRVKISAEKLVDAKGKVISSDEALILPTNLYLKWSGVLWRVTGDFLVG